MSTNEYYERPPTGFPPYFVHNHTRIFRFTFADINDRLHGDCSPFVVTFTVHECLAFGSGVSGNVAPILTFQVLESMSSLCATTVPTPFEYIA